MIPSKLQAKTMRTVARTIVSREPRTDAIIARGTSTATITLGLAKITRYELTG
jgi:hypothetical protein